MARVVMMCGPSGSGKSVVARGLEADGWVRLSVDVEVWARGIREQPVAPAVADDVDAVLRARLLDLVARGRDVVLDYSFWARSTRDEYRELLRPLGVEPETWYVETPRDVAIARVAARRATGPDDVVLTPDIAAAHVDGFEPPTPDEGPLRVIPGDLPPVD
ncbi:hypothetical protein GCM10025865_12750 [Paraoerskovia sediminicola]|uniref:Kinase n=1 Tax=Paraoerskovia sediminicola TaxID=1138587 RepID=A0ABM8G1Q9_9CELL|nr:ATP-binding protein [Paraoerskovia sediminicola]BDZ41976.1 hypothetical protein GCM10025865_12750 [Paraoerskovia sediminicola]